MNTNPNVNQLGRMNQGQSGMSGGQSPVNNSVPRFGQVQAPPTIPPISAQPRLNQFRNLSNGQSMPTQQSISSLPGRFVDDPSQIDPRDIPMDGTIAYYPTNDLSRIYAKAWDENMNLMSVTYVPENTVAVEPSSSSDDMEMKVFVDKRFDELHESLEKMFDTFLKNIKDSQLLRGGVERNNPKGKGGIQNGEQQ